MDILLNILQYTVQSPQPRILPLKISTVKVQTLSLVTPSPCHLLPPNLKPPGCSVQCHRHRPLSFSLHTSAHQSSPIHTAHNPTLCLCQWHHVQEVFPDHLPTDSPGLWAGTDIASRPVGQVTGAMCRRGPRTACSRRNLERQSPESTGQPPGPGSLPVDSAWLAQGFCFYLESVTNMEASEDGPSNPVFPASLSIRRVTARATPLHGNDQQKRRAMARVSPEPAPGHRRSSCPATRTHDLSAPGGAGVWDR